MEMGCRSADLPFDWKRGYLKLHDPALDQGREERMQLVMEVEGMEEQMGFRAFRGTIDGLFATVMGLQKRKEHNTEA